MQVEGNVDGKSCRLTVDTGAEKTLVRPELLDAERLPDAPQRLCGVTGHCVALQGPVVARVGVGGAEERLPVYAADLDEEGLLGFDYLVQTGACIDFGRKRMRVHGQEVPWLPEVGCAEVVTAERLHLAPRTERRVQCRLSRVMHDAEGIVEPSENLHLTDGVAVGRSLVGAGEELVTVLVANFSDEARRLPAGARLGTCEEVERTEQPSKSASTPAEGVLPDFLEDLALRGSANLTESQAERVRHTLTQYSDVFSRGDLDLGRTSLVKHSINTGTSAPIKCPPRRIAPARREEMQRTVNDLANQGVIEKSDSPWSSAVVLVKKKDGTQRFCVDYRALNDVTVKDSYPLPRIDDTLDALVGARWFSTLDLKSGYHQVEMAEEDKPKTAFSFGQGLWQFNVMPFGLCNAPGCFERLMERVLDGLQWRTALIYLDDVIVYGGTFEEELGRLEEVLQRLRKANLKLSPKKCSLFQYEVPFLGHVVSKDGVRTDPQKVAAVADWPRPTNVAEVRSYLGLCTYYRRFVQDFATIAAPLHRLTRKGVPFEWDEACQAAFDGLKRALVEAPVLPYPNPKLPYLLDTDASAEGIGAVLSQVKDGREHVVAYYSAKFSRPERNYCVTRKELLAVVKSLEHFQPYLYGAEFTVRTDHAALQWLKTLKAPEGQLARWLGRLEQFNYRIVHRPGRVHSNADSLSRRPCEAGCSHCASKDPDPVTRRPCEAGSSHSVPEGPDAVSQSPCEASYSHQARRDPDPVCRRLTVPANATEGNDRWREAQSADPALAPVVRWLRASGERPRWEEVSAESPATKCLVDQWETLRLDRWGVLVKRWEVLGGVGRDAWVVVVPRAKRAEVLRELHAGVTSGHLGEKKTLKRLRQRFYWVGMRNDVSEWCRACDVCSAKKGPTRRNRAPLQLYSVGAPMERVAVDIAGPLPMTPRGNRFVCVVMDYFTKWPEAYALPNHEAETVASVLVNECFTRFGVPSELHSDQGREFESRVFRECCDLLGVRKTRTTPLHPQSDGMVERFNRTLAQQLAKYCGANQEDWDVKLPAMLMAYRSAVHEATDYTPARLMFGRELRLPVDLATGRPPDVGLPTVTSGFAAALQENLVEVHHQVRGKLRVAGQAMKDYYDRRMRDVKYAVGDRVWLHNPRRKKGLSPKLQSPWEGPYTVIAVLSAVTYRIRRGRKRSSVVHVDRLWRYHGPGRYSWGTGAEEDPDYPSSDEEDRAELDPVDVEVADDVEEEAGGDADLEAGSAGDLDQPAASPSPSPPPRRPRRERRRPGWLTDFDTE